MDESIRVLHVDDEPGFAEMAATFLEREQESFTVVAETSAADGLERVSEASFDCVVSDYDMPNMDGLEFLDAVRETYPDLPFVLFTGKGSEEIASEAISHGVTDYLQKETGTDQYTVLANRIDNAVTQYRAEQAVEQTQQRFTKLVEHSTDIVSIIDPDGTYRYVAPSVERVLGYDAADLVGTNAVDLVHPDDRAFAVEELSKVASDPGAERAADFEVERADGEYCILEVKARNLLDVPAVEGIVLNIRDISERVALEDKLRENVDWLRRLYEASSDPDLGYTTKLERILELGTERLGLSVGYVSHFEDGDRRVIAVAGDRDAPAVGSVMPLSETFCRRTVESDGPFVVEDAVAEGWDDDPAYERSGFSCYVGAPVVVAGEGYGTLCFADPDPAAESLGENERTTANLLAQWAGYELTRQQRAEELTEVKRRLDIALDASNAYMWVWVLPTGIVERVGSVERVLGMPSEEVGDLEEFMSRIHPDYRDTAQEAYDRALETGDTYRVQYPIRRGDGEYLWVQDRGDVQTVDGSPDTIVGTIMDISAYKAREHELQHQNERLEDFVSIVSHDLRNPIQVALGYTTEIKGNDTAVEKINDSLHRMNGIIEDMLTMAKQGQRVEETETVALADVARSSWEFVETDDADLVVETDRTLEANSSRLQNLLENLFRNSVEHGSTGSRTGSDDAQQLTVRVGDLLGGFFVEDDGVGIPEADRANVLEPGFSTSDDGTGFGLNIVRDIAEAHGWKVTVTESPDGGARFEFSSVFE